jgi:hypothetical protein
MKDHRRRFLLAVSGIIALGMALVAQPTEFRERPSGFAAAGRAPWVPGSAIPMSSFDRNVAPAPTPH